MGTKIDSSKWWDKSWNPTTRCSPVSAGCQNCWAKAMAKRFWGSRKFSEVQCHSERLEQPLHWREPRKIAVSLMGDLFHEKVPFESIDKVVDVFNKYPQHIGQILTKRAKRMYEYSCFRYCMWPENIIGMVTVENQAMADLRIPILLQCGFKTTGVSIEPMLGGIWFNPIQFHYKGGIHGIIIGCESINGKAGRFCEDEQRWWAAARDLVNQGKVAGVPIFMKQCPINGKVSHDPAEWPEWARLREFPKGAKDGKSKDI